MVGPTITLTATQANGKTSTAGEAVMIAFVVIGASGNQKITGSIGNDNLDGGDGDDTYWVARVLIAQQVARMIILLVARRNGYFHAPLPG